MYDSIDVAENNCTACLDGVSGDEAYRRAVETVLSRERHGYSGAPVSMLLCRRHLAESTKSDA